MTHRIEDRTSEAKMLRAYERSLSPELLDRLVRRYQPLARSLAMRYSATSEPVEDLIQVANLGLVKAIQGFNPGRLRPFTADAVPTILGEIKRHFRDRVWNLRLPRGLQEDVMKVDGAATRLTEELGRPPTVTEIATQSGFAPERIENAIRAGEVRHTLSLETPRGGEEGATAVIDAIGGEDPGYDRVEAQFASESVELSEREQIVLRMRFAKGLTQREIGARIGVSQMQVSRISRGGVSKLLKAVQGRDPVADG